MITALHDLIEELEADASLRSSENLRQRIQALERIDAFNLDFPPLAADFRERSTCQHARALQAKLEGANLEAYEAIRRDIQQVKRANSLLQWARESAAGKAAFGSASDAGYDALDELVAGVLRFETPGPAQVSPMTGMVFYQPTPARHIFDLIDRTSLAEHDVLIDLGSGLGHVPLMVSICTSARSIGVELEPAYVACARKCAESLNLTNVSFIEQDARDADLTDGTVFYLYTPFAGDMFRAVLDSLRREAERRDIRICTFGPCAATVASEDWLQCDGIAEADRVSIFRSRDGRKRSGS